MSTDQFRAGMKPFFTGGQALAGSLTNQTHSATNVFVTFGMTTRRPATA